MRPDNAVPDVQLLKRFLHGELSRAESEPIERYLEQHPELASTPAELVKEDTLISSLRDSAGRPVADPPELAGLMDKLARLRPAGDDATQGMTNGGGGSGDAPELAPPQGPGEIGRLGGYRVLKVLGAGGMGMVYQAEDVHLQRPIALKVMRPEVAKNPANRERFLREARAAAKLKSDHVVNIYQAGEERQIVFLAMEFLEGMSLDEWLKKGRTPTPAQAARMGRQIALGLADAHACGLVHRDIKPGNIWLDSRHQGRVKLLDFGLARGNAEEIHLTQSGAIVGTPAYMAPEQARGEHVDHRCDLFSLGVVLYRLTTGRLPFRGDNTMSILTSLALDAPPAPREINPDIPPRMAVLIERLLSKDREWRPATAKAVADELAIIEREAAQSASDEHTVQVNRAASVSAPVAAPAPLRSRLRWLTAASLLLLLGGVTAAIIVIIRDKDGKKIAEIDVPPGGSVETKDKEERKAKAPPKEDTKIAAAPLSNMLPGEPLSPVALVQRPAKLPGVRSWSIEKRDPWMTTAVAYRPDGQRLAVGDWDGSVRIWEPQSGRLVQVCLGVGPVQFLAWSPDGKALAVGSWRESLHKNDFRLWGAETGRLLRTLELPPSRGGSRALAWSADGRALLALHPNDGGCLLWNAADGKLLRKVAIPCHGPAAFSPDAKWLAGPTADSRFALWDVETGKEVRKLGECKPSSLPALAWSPDGKRLALAAADGVHVWQATTGERIVHAKDLPQCHSLCWSPDGRTFAAGRADFGISVVDLAAEGKPRGLEDGALSSLAWSPDGKTIARIAWGGGGGGGWVRLYDAATGKRQRALAEGEPFPNTTFAWSMAGPSIAWSENWKTSLSSVDTGQSFATLKDAVGPLAWSPDGKRLATRGREAAVVILWEDDGKTRLALKGHQQDVSCLAWSPDGKRLASSSAGEKRVLLWDAEKVERIRELGPFPVTAEQLTWSPNGRLIAFRTSPIGWHFWDVEQNKLINDPKQWQTPDLAFTPDGRSAFTWLPHFCQLRELATGKEQSRLDGPYLRSPTLSLDGRLAAIPTGWGVELWRGDLRRRLRTLQAGQIIEEAAFSADGKLVAGRAGDRLRIWESDTGRLGGILLLGEKNNGLTLAADGRYTGNDQVERGLVVVVQKDDGMQELLEPTDFEQKYGWKNEPDKVHLLQPLPPPLYPQRGMPMGPLALVREPAELPDANSWTIETLHSRGGVTRAVVYRPDGKLLATGGDDGAIRIWDAANGKLVRMLSGDHRVGSLSWSKDGKTLTAGWLGGSAGREWEVDTGRLRRRLDNVAQPAAMTTARSPDGKQTVTADEGGVRIADAATGKPLHALEDTAHVNYTRLAWSPDGRSLALTYDFPGKSGLRIAETATGRLLPLPADYERAGAWSPDGKTLAVMGSDQRVRLLDAASYRVARTLEDNIDGGTGLAWSADGKFLAGSAHASLHVWSLATGKELWKSDKRATVAAWSPDGRRLATSDNNLKGAVRIWEAETGKLRHEVPLQSSALAWSPDGKTLIAGPTDPGEALVIDAGSGAVKLRLKDGVRALTCIRWSPDGKTFTTLNAPGLLRVWDAATGEARRTTQLPGVVDFIRSAAWSPDGQMLAWANGDAIHLHDAAGAPLGVLLPLGTFGQLAVTADGRFRGNARIERLIRMVVQKRDGTTETLTPGEFERKYGFKNDPATVRLTDK